MRLPYSVFIGKTVKKAAQLRGGGSALPGLVMEKIDGMFVARTLENLPRGVVVISGTNGKTTTTKMVVELLESQGLTVFTNRTGSNFVRGVGAALIGAIDRHGKLDADIAVLELDEAHAVHFVKQVRPNYCLLLNVLRDQLDRFGEIDTTAKMLLEVARATTRGVVINRDDPRLADPKFLNALSTPYTTYGVAASLYQQFPSDDTMRSTANEEATPSITRDDTELSAIDGQTATITYHHTSHTLKLKLRGIYNIQNAVGAVALCRHIMGRELHEPQLLKALRGVTPAFGRGETIVINGQAVELVLVKNPSGFRLSLQSFHPDGYATMIAINDNYADGRDMSWLWDVDFDSLRSQGVALVSGVRAYDMAIRLRYDDVPFDAVETKLEAALRQLIDTHANRPKRIYCTYTAMLSLRQELSKITKVEKALS